MNAKLIICVNTVEVRFARIRKDTWPGYDRTCPLGKRGYWAGTGSRHTYIGATQAEYLTWLESVKI